MRPLHKTIPVPPATPLGIAAAAISLACFSGCAATPAAEEPPLRQVSQPVAPLQDPEAETAPVKDPKLAAIEAQLELMRRQLEGTAPDDSAGEVAITPDPFDLPPTDGVVDLRSEPESAPRISDIEPLIEPRPTAIVIEPTPVQPQPTRQEPTPVEPELATFESAAPTVAAAFDRRLDAAITGKPATEVVSLLPSERRVLDTVAQHVAEFRSGLGQSPDVEDQVRPILDAADALRREIGLTLPTIALCSSVRIFGDYTPVGPTFSTGRAHPVVLYVEADGFRSEQQADGRWLTRLSLSAVLYDEEGRPVMSLPPKPARDVSRRQRRDFFLSGLITLPAHAASGRHRLKVTVRDELAGRVAQQSVPVMFVSGN